MSFANPRVHGAVYREPKIRIDRFLECEVSAIMPKENKSTSRRNRRQCSEVDNEVALKSIIGSNRYSPFPREPPRRDTRTEKDTMAIPTTGVLHSTSGSIIGNGIKYIMFPLHLLRFCIFGTNSGTVDAQRSIEYHETAESSDEKREIEEKGKISKEREEKKSKEETSSGRSSEKKESRRSKEETSSGRSSEKEESRRSKEETSSGRSLKKEESRRSKSTSGTEEEARAATPPREKSKEEEKSDNDDSGDEMVTAAEDSDSSVDQWSSARSTILMNMSMDIDRSMSHGLLEEPMDISMEEHTFERSYSAIKISQNTRASESCPIAGSASAPARLDEKNNNSSVDEEIARIFQKQCTSSEDEFPPTAASSCKREKKQKNFLYNERDNGYASASKEQEDDRERKKKTFSDYSIAKRRKVGHEDDKNGKQEKDRKNESIARDERRSSRQDTPSKQKSRSSRTPVKSKESKRKDVKFKETATQTDSAFSDDDVEMIPVETKTPENHVTGKFITRKSQLNLLQGIEMEQEWNYVADNEDSSDGFINVARKRISPCSTSSSLTDLGFEERVSGTPEMDPRMGRWHTNLPDVVSASRTCSRPPPGFPELPQNPPLMSCTCNNSKQLVLSTIAKENCPDPSVAQATAIVPPAPTPMRHLYYNYPEFMDLPPNVHSSKILKNILMNNYYL